MDGLKITIIVFYKNFYAKSFSRIFKSIVIQVYNAMMKYGKMNGFFN
jgi:hypothetical protein